MIDPPGYEVDRKRSQLGRGRDSLVEDAGNVYLKIIGRLQIPHSES